MFRVHVHECTVCQESLLKQLQNKRITCRLYSTYITYTHTRAHTVKEVMIHTHTCMGTCTCTYQWRIQEKGKGGAKVLASRPGRSFTDRTRTAWSRGYQSIEREQLFTDRTRTAWSRGYQSIEREQLFARQIWGHAHFRCIKTRENPILSQGKSHLRLARTATNSQLASLG